MADLTYRRLAASILVAHQRRDSASCLCGWSELGKSHADHVAEVLDAAGALRDRPPLREPGHYAFDETTCDRCSRTNPVWSTPVEVWQQVYGPGGQPTRQGVLCPSCFIDDAETAGVTAPQGTAGWTVTPDDREVGRG